MKKILLLMIVVFVLLSLVSCGNTASTVLLDKSNIWLIVTAYPSISVVDGTSTPYTVYCQLQDQSAADSMGDFSGVTITINGYTFPYTSASSNYWSSHDDISLAVSDTLTVFISHPSFGSVELTGRVPPSLTSFNTTQTFPASGDVNTLSSYDLSWTGIGVDEYSPKYWAYKDADGTIFIEAIGYYTTGTSYTLNVTDGTPYPFLELSVSTIDKTLFTDFSDSSALRIEGTFIPEIKNTN